MTKYISTLKILSLMVIIFAAVLFWRDVAPSRLARQLLKKQKCKPTLFLTVLNKQEQ